MTSFLNQLAGLIIDGKRNKGEPHKVRPYFIKLQICFCCNRRKHSCFARRRLVDAAEFLFKTTKTRPLTVFLTLQRVQIMDFFTNSLTDWPSLKMKI